MQVRFVMSGWPQGAVDSLRRSADVLTGFGPFAHFFAPSLHSLQKGQGCVCVCRLGWMSGGVHLKEGKMRRERAELSKMGKKI